MYTNEHTKNYNLHNVKIDKTYTIYNNNNNINNINGGKQLQKGRTCTYRVKTD